MKIAFTGGGTGGHFYPIIAVAESIQKISQQRKFISPELYFFAPTPYNQGILYDHKIKYKKVTAGKLRRYFSIMNFVDIFKTAWGSFIAFFDMFSVFPDVLFSKGGFGSFPAVLAAFILRIPVVVHESDSVPGIVNKFAGRFATRVALSYEEAAKYFDAKKTEVTGQPILEDKKIPITANAFEFFGLESSIPTIFIMGGSQGSETINNAVLDSLVDLVKDFQIIHQTGKVKFEPVKESAEAILINQPNKNRYKPIEYLNSLEMMMAAGASSVIVSRGGSTIFEIAAWGIPSIIIPITHSNGDHQVKNAFSYAKYGACSVIKEENLKSHIFLAEIRRILGDKNIIESMKNGSKQFFKQGAADTIAQELLSIAISHQKLD